VFKVIRISPISLKYYVMGEYILGIKEKVGRYSNLLVILFALFLVLSLFRNVNRINKARERIEEKNVDVQELAEDNEELRRRIEEIESTEYIERQIRDNLGMVKEGEVVIILPEDDVLKALAPEMFVEIEDTPQANWEKWKDLFL
jgi:cell division protein FtsB